MVNAEQNEPADSTDDFDDECDECGALTTQEYCQRCAEILDAKAAEEEGK